MFFCLYDAAAAAVAASRFAFLRQWGAHFEEKSRMFEMQIQGKLKLLPTGEVIHSFFSECFLLRCRIKGGAVVRVFVVFHWRADIPCRMWCDQNIGILVPPYQIIPKEENGSYVYTRRCRSPFCFVSLFHTFESLMILGRSPKFCVKLVDIYNVRAKKNVN